jgi:hypothetical protein
MTPKILTIALFITAALAQEPSATPRVIRFSGQVTATEAQPVQTAIITFAFYTGPQGGSSVWAESQQVKIENGRFTALLGSTQPDGLPVSLFANGQALWVEYQVGGQDPAPRTQLVSAPYALSSANAETLAGHPISDFVLSTAPTKSDVTEAGRMQREGEPVQSAGGGQANMLAKFTGTSSTMSSQVYDNGTSVGVGTIAPSAKLEVAGDLKISGDGNALVFPDGTRFSASQASGISARNIEQVRYADQFAAGSQTGGIAEAYADCPATGCKVQLGADVTIASPQSVMVKMGKPLVLDLAGRLIKVSNASGVGLTFTSENINARTPMTITNGTLACSWTAPNLVGFEWISSVNVSLENLDVRSCNTPGSVAILWDFVEDAHMNAVGFRFNSGALRVQNASNQVSFHNVWFDSNVDPIVFQDNSGITLEDCLVQSNTGRRAVQMLSSAGSNATTLRIHKCHFENNGDGSASSRNIYIAPAMSQVIIGVSVEDNVFTAGAAGAAGTSLEVAGSQNVSPITFKNNQYNGYTRGRLVTGVSNGSRVTSIGENLAAGDYGYDVGINTHGLSGLSFAPEGARRGYQIFAGWPNNYDGFLQFWDTTSNTSILSYSSASSSWNFSRTAVFGSALVVDNSQTIAGYSDHQQTQTWSISSATGSARFNGGANLGSAGLSINGAASLTTTAQTGTGALVMSNSAALTNPNIGNATATSINLNGDVVTAAPRMVYSAFIPNLSGTGIQSRFSPDKAIVVTRFQFVINSGSNSGCTTAAVLRLTDGATQVSLPLSNDQNVLDSGSVSLPFAGGADLDIKIATLGSGCATVAASGNATVQYRMQ